MLGTLASIFLTASTPLAAVPLSPPCVMHPVYAAQPVLVVRATGIGYSPPRMKGVQARLMARRAAEVVAVRNLAVKLGLGANAWVRHFKYVSVRQLQGGAVEVVVEAPRTDATGDGATSPLVTGGR